MEIGTPQSLFTPDGFELPFNDFSGNPAALFSGTPILSGLPVGAGYMIQSITGADGADIRNPTENRPHKQGGIVHRFYEAASIWTVEGLVLPEGSRSVRTQLDDALKGAVRKCLQLDGRYFFHPSGGDLRFRTVRQYGPVDISRADNGIAGPRTFSFTLYSEDPHSYKATQDSTDIAAGTSGAVPNAGNVETWPVIKIHGPIAGAHVTITNTDTGFLLEFLSATIASGHYWEVNTFNETIYLDGNSTNELPQLDLSTSDFFSVEAGGSNISADGADITVLSNSAWI